MPIDARLVKALVLIWEVTHDTFFDQEARSAYWRLILRILGKTKTSEAQSVPLEAKLEALGELEPVLKPEPQVEPELKPEPELEVKHELEPESEVNPRSRITRNTWPLYVPPHERPKPDSSFGRSKAVKREMAEIPHDTSE